MLSTFRPAGWRCGAQAFAVIRKAIRKEGVVAVGKVVFTSREHIIALEARDIGLLGMTLRYPYEVRKQAQYFDEIPAEKVPKDILDLALRIRLLAAELRVHGALDAEQIRFLTWQRARHTRPKSQ
jgi:DNA end-binding protein Ku